MKESGINVNIYGFCLTRSASTSKRRIIENQQNDQMKTRLRNFITSHFKRTFQTIYLDEIFCFFICSCIYGVIYTGKIYGFNYSRNNTNQTKKEPGLLIILHSFSQIAIYTRGMEANKERIYKLNQHLLVKFNLNSSLFLVLEYRQPPTFLKTISM